MTLHEYLEKKRRQNIERLNASGACHICASTCRTSHLLSGSSHDCDDDNDDDDDENDDCNDDEEHNDSMERRMATTAALPRPSRTTMRTCGCHGIPKDDEMHWPYSLRVCELCLADDARTGRIRCCGICGAIACDELCGVELVECTDCEEWNNAGCLECRKMQSFSEMGLFRRGLDFGNGYNGCDGNNGNSGYNGYNGNKNGGCDRATRICTKCLQIATPWVKYDFECRRYKCSTRLVPSYIVERKRHCTFGSSPLNSLPEDGLVAIVNFLSARDLVRLYRTCSAMCVVAERVAKEKVLHCHALFPSGPLVEEKRRVFAEGKNDFRLRAPDDAKAWVGVYYYMDRMATDLFYFGFQEEEGAASRYLQTTPNFEFGPTLLSEVGGVLVPHPQTDGMLLAGGQLFLTSGLGDIAPVVASSSHTLSSGTHHYVCRLLCPGSGSSRTHERLGSIGILRHAPTGTTTWARRINLWENWQYEEYVVGLEFNVDQGTLLLHHVVQMRLNNMLGTNRYLVEEAPGSLSFAAELSSKALSTKHTQLSVRQCTPDEWNAFLAHSHQIQMESPVMAQLEDYLEEDPENNFLLADIIDDHPHARLTDRMRFRMERRARPMGWVRELPLLRVAVERLARRNERDHGMEAEELLPHYFDNAANNPDNIDAVNDETTNHGHDGPHS